MVLQDSHCKLFTCGVRVVQHMSTAILGALIIRAIVLRLLKVRVDRIVSKLPCARVF